MNEDNMKQQYSLIILVGNNIRSYTLDSKNEFTIGRKTVLSNPHINLESPYISKEHGKLFFNNGKWFYQDMNSSNGTIYNGKKISIDAHNKVQAVQLFEGDILSVQDNRNDENPKNVWIFFTNRRIRSEWQKFLVRSNKTVSIGRNTNENEIILKSKYVSNIHATIFAIDSTSVKIKDASSTAGVIVNGIRVKDDHVLNNYDVIFLADRTLIYLNHILYYEGDEQHDVYGCEKYLLKAYIKTKRVPNRSGKGNIELVKDIRLKIRDKSLVALLGPAGAGKSTVMNFLNGMDTIGVEGRVLFDGVDLVTNFNRLKYLIGSVPQENVFHEMLTVEEELREAAILRLPASYTTKDVQKRVDITINQLRINHIRNKRISLCSGGEKRRVNIAIDLVADRKLYCMDEPEAGLDAGMRQELYAILRNMAHEEGKCILAIIHDVSELHYFDQIVIIAKLNNVGRLAFSGTPDELEHHFGTKMSNVYQLLQDNPEKYIR